MSCCTELKHGEPRLGHWRGSWHSSTPALEESLGSDGLRPSATKNSTKQQPAEDEILQRCWRWIGHTLRKPVTHIACQALTWNPQGKRKHGRPRNTWCRDLEAETKIMNYTWEQLERLAQDWDAWRALVGGYAPVGAKRNDDGNKWESSETFLYFAGLTPPFAVSVNYSQAFI